jgi:hypothetical protein
VVHLSGACHTTFVAWNGGNVGKWCQTLQAQNQLMKTIWPNPMLLHHCICSASAFHILHQLTLITSRDSQSYAELGISCIILLFVVTFQLLEDKMILLTFPNHFIIFLFIIVSSENQHRA